MKNKNVIHLLLMVFSLQIVSACSRSTQPEIVEKTPSPKNTEVVITQTPIPTLTLTPTPSVIPLPTLTSQEKIDQVAEIQTSNGGCNLPCWWGITPGVTTWDDAFTRLGPLAVENLEFKVENGAVMHYLEFPFQPRNIIPDIFVQENGVVDVILLDWDEPLLDFLHTHGSPTEIWISSDGKVPVGNSVFTISLFYPEKGLMITYFGDARLVSQGSVDYVMICGSDFQSLGVLWLWNPNSKKQFNELPVENLIGGPPATSKLKRIGEHTNFDEMGFYNSVVQNPEKTCLETQADIWPNPDFFITPTPKEIVAGH
ncbi:MAG: hypothetical protein ABIU06_16950 [Anaerolineales bacterium]